MRSSNLFIEIYADFGEDLSHHFVHLRERECNAAEILSISALLDSLCTGEDYL